MSSISGASSLMAMAWSQRSDVGQRSNSMTSHVSAADVIGATSGTVSAAPEKSLIDQILEKGLMKWGQEQRMEELKAKLRAEALQGLGLTEEDLAKMEPELQASIEDRIEQMIRERLEAALNEKQGTVSQGAAQYTAGATPSTASKEKPAFIITV